MNTTRGTVADLLVRRLKDHGVRHVFGYPGGQLTPLYDALHRDGTIRHVLARDEQAAGFMADGYARATGQIGVCLAVCGPGVYNAATPLANAYTDSIPILCISGQVPSTGLGLRSGYYHENDQLSACQRMVKGARRVTSGSALVGELDSLFTTMRSGRPGPGFLELPIDVQLAAAEPAPAGGPPSFFSNFPPQQVSGRVGEVDAFADWLAGLRQPLILAGGGVISAGAESTLEAFAERLGAPVLHTLMGKCAMRSDHPLSAGLVWLRATSDVSNMEDNFSPLLRQADGLVAIGCRFSQAASGSWRMPRPATLGHIDIDPAELGRHFPPAQALAMDAKDALVALLERLPKEPRPAWAKLPIAKEPWRLPGWDLVGLLRQALPRDAIVAADITRLGYILLADLPMYARRSFLHPAGFVSMGHGLPAALAAQVAFPERVVIAVAGDGCFLMSGMELATAVQEKLPVITILVNDRCLSLIKSTQHRRYNDRFIAVDLVNPDFGKFAEAFGVRSWRVENDHAFEKALRQAIQKREPALIEVQL